MKILKIELQNINSLKSETPVVIDFENEPFKDVGLYAITGVLLVQEKRPYLMP